MELVSSMGQELTASCSSSPFVLSLNEGSQLDFSDRSGTKHVFVPDETKGFFNFQLAKAFPFGATAHGTGLHPAVTERSFQSLHLQNLNFEHQLAEYHKVPGKTNTVRDRVIGGIAAVDYPSTPSGGWKIAKDAADAPCINAVATYWKLTQGMKSIIGEHMTSRHQWTVSMEVQYTLAESGFAVRLKEKPKFAFTPDDMLAAGWEYVPFDKSPKELQECFSREKNRVTKRFQGREVFVLMGGIENRVHFAGVGLVRYGAEPTAKISRMTANDGLTAPFNRLEELLGRLRVSS